MPLEGWQILIFEKLSNGYTEEAANPIWQYHKYIPYSKPDKVHDQIKFYGTPKDLDDFCLKMAGFYGCCSAAEPIHVQLNLAAYSIEVV
ncbi:mannosylglycoprotein endo-beta-mannosidase-like isoform X3 [Eucalyptus grandis]|uniref:mannosylglycoprotein endo-beta-mannosidase-like isoform X3 n=1 Tax=Eucalyptus grandis TaxID=71139 RepID=UPI0008A0CDC2|nr:mannosylglycoprotein endo-beta-mannosidase-like isoform X3 [Eucalyptus grandis]